MRVACGVVGADGGRGKGEDREAREGGRVKSLEDEPVRDDVLDVVGHHRDEARREVRTEVRVAECGERLAARRGYGGQVTVSRLKMFGFYEGVRRRAGVL